MSLTLTAAETIITATLAHAKSASFKPLGIVVLDSRGTVKAASIADGSSLARFDIARAKAQGALAFNMGTRGLEKLAKERPHFFCRCCFCHRRRDCSGAGWCVDQIN